MELIEKEKQLSSYQGEDRVVKSTEIAEHLAGQRDPFSFMSKIPSIDEWSEGFEAGELIVISGLTGQGKTSWARTLSFNFFAQSIPSLWFSYEMTYRQFLKDLHEDLFVFMPMVLKGRSMDWIQDRIHEAKIKHGVRAVFIDHLHFLVDMAKIRNPSLEIGAIVRGLKRIALELNVTIFLIAHLTKTKFEEEPELDAIRDSSFIPQDADQVYIVWRKYDTSAKEYLNQTYVKLCKSRRTGTMGKKVLLNYRFKLYFEEAKEYGEPERFEKRERYESRTLIDI
jgi:replicative DNA helicase